ncbi:MAG: hypothetical protein V1492_05415 [Candidatus Micrarchaeota archaeon]
MFDKKTFSNFVVSHNVVGFFNEPLKLKSGRLSHWYVNWRTVTEDAFLTDKLTDFIIEFAQEKKLTAATFYGVPEGATKIGVLAQYKNAKRQKFAEGSHVLAMGRGKPKEHGDPKDKYFLGMPRGKTIVLEDVTTTGGSLIETIKKLKEANVEIIAAIGLTNRMEKRDDGKTVEQMLAELGVKYYAMSEATELLPSAYKKQKPSADVKAKVEEYFKLYGIKEVVL